MIHPFMWIIDFEISVVGRKLQISYNHSVQYDVFLDVI
jgi:hypothetical protein